MMNRKTPVEIRDRHTGELLILGRWSAPNGLYLGHRVPKDLRSADLRGLDLREADVTGRDLSDADLTGTNLAGTKYDARSQWPAGLDPELHGAVRVPVDL